MFNLISILLQHHISKLSRYICPTFWSVEVSIPYTVARISTILSLPSRCQNDSLNLGHSRLFFHVIFNFHKQRPLETFLWTGKSPPSGTCPSCQRMWDIHVGCVALSDGCIRREVVTSKDLFYCTTTKYFLLLLSFNLLIGWEVSIWNSYKPFFSLLYEQNILTC
jgi:hypothetical protein